MAPPVPSANGVLPGPVQHLETDPPGRPVAPRSAGRSATSGDRFPRQNRRRGEPLEERILDAALALTGRWGVAKTSLGAVAAETGCSRATLYRVFPGGKAELFRAMGIRELDRYLVRVTGVIDGADRLDDALAETLAVAAGHLRDHQAAQYVLANEPELLLPFLGFKRVEVLYTYASSVLGPHLARFMPADRAAWCAEWGARLLITYVFNPDPAVDLADPVDARGLIADFVLPAFTNQNPASPH